MSKQAIYGLSLAALLASAWVEPAVANTPPAAAIDKRSQTHLDQARKMLEKGDVRAAVVELKNAVRADTRNVEARFLLGVSEVRIGEFESGEKNLRVALEAGYPEERVTPALAEALLRQGRNADILKEIRPGDRGAEAESIIAVVRGTAQLSLNQIKDAEASFNESIRLRPSSPAYVGAARVALAANDLAKASALASEATRLDPKNIEALITRADILGRENDLAGAMSALDAAVATDGRSARARLARAALLVSSNQLDKASADVEAIIASQPRLPAAVYYRSLIEARRGNYKAAYDYLQAIQATLGTYPPALYLYGMVSYQANNLEQARTALGSFLETNPDNLTARKVLGALTLRQGDAQQAVRILEPALKVGPDDSQLLMLLGSANMALGRAVEATQFFDRADELGAENPTLQTEIAINRIRLGDTDRALGDLRGALDRDPSLTQAHAALILAHIRKREFDQAKAVVADMRAKMPASPVPDHYAGTVALYERDMSAARQGFEAALGKQAEFIPSRLALGRIEASERKFDAAREHFSRALRSDPKNTEAMIYLAELHLLQDKADEAVRWMERAIAANPQAVGPRLRLVSLLLSRKQADRALVSARELISIAPSNPDAVDALARAQLATNDTASAVASYRRVADLLPQSAVAQHRLAGALIAANDRPGARRALMRAIDLDGAYVPAQQDAILLEREMSGPEAALALARQIASRRPDNPTGDMLVGALLFSEKRFAEATKAFEAAQAKAPSTAIILRVFESRLRGGDAKGAEQTLASWLDRNPRDSAARFALASHLLSSGKQAEARAEHETLLKDTPNNPIMLNNLAWLLREVDGARAVSLAEQAHKLAPQSPEIADTLAVILMSRGENARAVELLRPASDRAPNNAQIRLHLAQALVKSGKAAEARPLLEQLAKLEAAFDGKEEARRLLAELPR